MWLYFLIFFIALIGVGVPDSARSKAYLTSFFVFLALFVGLGDMLGGYDRYIYTDLFDGLFNNRIRGIPVSDMAIWGYHKEFGYVYINYAISFITGNRYIFVLILTSFFYAMMFLSFKEYMDSYPIAIVLFLALMFFFTFTYLREITAVGFAWFAIRYVYRRNFKMFLLFVYITYICHNSALVLFPLYFIPTYKFNKGIVLIVMGILFVIGLTPFPTSLFEAYSGVMDDGGRSASYAGDFDAGTFRYEYLIEAAFFLYVILTNYERIPETKKNIVMTNAAIVFCGIIIFFVRSTNGGRLGWYYMIGVIATLTTILSQQTIAPIFRHGIMIVCFMLFFRIVYYWGILLSPYKTFLTPGHREGDHIFYKFEYDFNYDVDKFYRPVFVLFKSRDELQRGEGK